MALKIVDWSKIELNLGNGIAESATSNVIKRYNKEVSSYIVERVKFSLGVGKVYVYDYDGKIVEYEKCLDIKESLERARLNFPHFYIYLHFNDNYSGSNEFLSKLRMEIGEEI